MAKKKGVQAHLVDKVDASILNRERRLDKGLLSRPNWAAATKYNDFGEDSDGATFLWYDTGVKTIKLHSSVDSTSWITETSVGTYTIVVPEGEELQRVSFLVTTASGGSQNAPSGTINFVIDDSANSRNQTIADASPVTAVGINVTAGQTYPLGTLNANAHTINTTFAANQMTVRINGFPGQFADGSKIVVFNFNGE